MSTLLTLGDWQKRADALTLRCAAYRWNDLQESCQTDCSRAAAAIARGGGAKSGR